MFKRPFSFKGRIRRTEFWLSIMIYWAIAISLAYLPIYVVNEVVNLGIVALFIVLFWLVFAQSSKRCHDLGRNRLWMFMPLYVVRMLFIEGGVRANKYGENPKGARDPRLKLNLNTN